jgi:hypothetical protein
MIYAITWTDLLKKRIAYYSWANGYRPEEYYKPICYECMIPGSHIFFIYGDEALYLWAYNPIQ